MELKTEYYKSVHQLFATHTAATKSLGKGNHYANYAKWFFVFLEEKGISTLRTVTPEVMKEYFHHLVTRPKRRGDGCLSARSVNDNLSTLGMLSKRLVEGNEQLLLKPLAIPKFIKETDDEDADEQNHSLPYKLKRETLTTDEVKQVYNACQNSLERALIALAYGCGMRRGSLESLEEKHIDFVQGTVVAEADKFNKTRTVPISDFFLKVLKTYAHERLELLLDKGRNHTRFFINERGHPINGNSLNTLLKTIIARTQNPEILAKNITLHCLRHTIATNLMDVGQSFEYVRKFLGHSEIDTTTIYAKRRKIKTFYQI